MGLRSVMMDSAGDELARALRAWAGASPQNREVLEQLSALLRGVLEGGASPAGAVAASGASTCAPTHDKERAATEAASAREEAAHDGPARDEHGRDTIAREAPVVVAPKPITGPKLAPEYARTILNQGLGNAITREGTGTGTGVRDGVPTGLDRREDAGESLDRALLARRFDVKARCCAFVLERDQASKRGESLWNFQKDRYEGIKADAAACDARLWMLRAWEDGVDESHATMVINGFKNLAQAMELIEEEDPAPEILELVAEAQSAVRALCEDHDLDQTRVFMWLRQQTDRRRIFLRRYMADATRADPANWADLRERLTRALQKRRADAERDRALKKPLQRALFHARKIETAASRGQLADAEDWQAIERAMRAFEEAGGSLESNAWLDAIAPASKAIEGVEVVEHLRESLARAASRMDDGEEEATLRGWERSPAPELEHVRAFLRGREIVLVGGTRRPLAEESITKAFELSGLRWLDFGEHKSLELYKPDVARPNVVLVLAMIRFMSHAYDDLREVCQKHGKLYARLKGGYSPNQIATQVWEQLSGQIEGSQRPAE